MHFLYVDESGAYDNSVEPFVVGGVAVHESGLDELRREVEAAVALRLDAHLHGLELHAQPMRSGGGVWRRVHGPARDALVEDILTILGTKTPSRRLFAVAHSPGAVPRADRLERVFEELLLRFSSYLSRYEQKQSGKNDRALGIVVADEAKYERILQPLVDAWRKGGTRFGRLTRIVEVPLFVDSAATRLTQLADFVAHGVFRHYARNDNSHLERLLPGFDGTSAKLHGLTHLAADHATCKCPACVNRQASSVSRASRSKRRD